jgi:hypothetical protein
MKSTDNHIICSRGLYAMKANLIVQGPIYQEFLVHGELFLSLSPQFRTSVQVQRHPTHSDMLHLTINGLYPDLVHSLIEYAYLLTYDASGAEYHAYMYAAAVHYNIKQLQKHALVQLKTYLSGLSTKFSKVPEIKTIRVLLDLAYGVDYDGVPVLKNSKNGLTIVLFDWFKQNMKILDERVTPGLNGFGEWGNEDKKLMLRAIVNFPPFETFIQSLCTGA